MRGKLTLYVDQYGNMFRARTVRELREMVGGGAIHRMFRDKEDGT